VVKTTSWVGTSSLLQQGVDATAGLLEQQLEEAAASLEQQLLEAALSLADAVSLEQQLPPVPRAAAV